MIGRTVGTYRILEKIGEGGMGTVYKGVDQMLERTVAVKVLRAELAREPSIVERFRSEAITLARLNHPNVATLYSFLREGDDFFMVMEYVPGETLEDLLKKGPMPVPEAIPLFCQALDGIAHAHALGIIHRDLKPANVMLTPEGVVKVMDFGIARVLGTARMTRTGHLIGTIEYMAPEQVRGRETDARSDVYALGIVLYEMVTGQVPFEADSDFELMRAQAEDRPPPPRTVLPSVPTTVEKAILRALAKSPDARFQTVTDFRDALEESLQQNTTTSTVIRGGIATRFRSLLWPEQALKPARSPETRLTDAATPPPAEIKATRLAGPKETRLATDEAATASAPSRRAATWQGWPLWKVGVAVAVPLLLAVLLWGLWTPDPGVQQGAEEPTDSSVVMPEASSLEKHAEREDTAIRGAEQPRSTSGPKITPLDESRYRAAEQPAQEDPPRTTRRELEQRTSTAPRTEPPRSSVEETPAPPRLGILRVLVRPFGDVYVNGTRKAAGTSRPYIEQLSAGTYRVRVVHPSYGTWEKAVQVRAEQDRDVVFNFNAEYRLTVTSNPPNAEILIDGQSTGRYTPSVVTVRPGQHTITVRKRGFQAAGSPKQMLVEGDRQAPIHFDLHEN
ncbi:MAG TPA: serine/threonine-protein kinase [Rhodothermales bacterium]|nr:serine/threonine-protein kinase [Rhodothermales bacterium]